MCSAVGSPWCRRSAMSRWPAKALKAKSLRRRLLVDQHTLPELPFGRSFPLIRVLLEIGIYFI